MVIPNVVGIILLKWMILMILGGELTTPGKYFGNKTREEIREILEKKFGPPKSTRPYGDTYYNPLTQRSFNVHQEPGHLEGKPHVDIRRRGNFPERKYLLKETD